MMELTKKDILSSYDYFKKVALKFFQQGNLDSSLDNIELCAKLAYHSNYFYVDNQLEATLADIAKKIGDSIYEEVSPIIGRYAFIDTNGSDNHGLSQQYIRALISMGIEFVYIYVETDLSRIGIILEELRAYPKASIYTFDQEYTLAEKTRLISVFLANYRPEKYLMHIMPWDVVAILLCNLLKGVKRYNINATDHAFWLGASCIDYSIEFRNYGYSVSIDKRGLRSKQLLLLPYYPIINKTSFKGFPDTLPKNCIKIFSGGSFYKILGESGLYFKIVKRILEENPKAVLLYAGTGDHREMLRFISDNNLNNRIFLLGNRSDIYEVFDAADLYLATFPISGGLMSQYAAISGTHILSYTSQELAVNRLESTVCHQFNKRITYNNLEELYAYAYKLCVEDNFRLSEGKNLEKSVISPELFNEELSYLLQNNSSKRQLSYEKVDYERFSELYLEVENHFLPAFQRLVGSKLRLKTIYLFPKIFINLVFIIIKDFFNKKS